MATFLAGNVRQALEHGGIDAYRAESFTFMALRPADLKLGISEWDEESTVLSWDGFEFSAEKSPTEGCLWDLIDLARTPSDERCLDFVQRWGLPSYGVDDAIRLDKPEHYGEMQPQEWVDKAIQMQNALSTLIATHEGLAVTPADLFPLMRDETGYVRHADEEEDWDAESARAFKRDVALAQDGKLDFREHQAREQAREIEHWNDWRRRDLASGRAIEYQRMVLTQFIQYEAGQTVWDAKWDDAGRHLRAEVIGTDGLVGARLRSIFAAPEIDVFSCSLCGRLFDFRQRGTERRPRANARRFCSDECRDEAKRESNRLSWQRNGARWRTSQRNATSNES